MDFLVLFLLFMIGFALMNIWSNTNKMAASLERLEKSLTKRSSEPPKA